MENKNTLVLSISILLSAVIVAGALVYTAGKKSLSANDLAQNEEPSGSVDAIKPVSDKDHLRGNPNAPVKLITFEDTECPFCKRFHSTMFQVMKDYKDQVAWVYRHFPLEAIHSKARKEANATECVAALGGNDAFWSYLDKLFEVTPSNDGLDVSLLPKLAAEVGVDKAKFEECLKADKYDQRVSDDLADATASGGQGTPYTIVIGKDGKKSTINGAFPYEEVKKIIDQALK